MHKSHPGCMRVDTSIVHGPKPAPPQVTDATFFIRPIGLTEKDLVKHYSVTCCDGFCDLLIGLTIIMNSHQIQHYYDSRLKTYVRKNKRNKMIWET